MSVNANSKPANGRKLCMTSSADADSIRICATRNLRRTFDLGLFPFCRLLARAACRGHVPYSGRSTMKRASPPNFDVGAFRRALSQFATGVTVITTRAPSGQLIGITASSFNSVSLDPPLVLWSLATKSASMSVFQANSHYVVNVLAASQLDLCQRLATVKADRFAGASHAAGDTGMPVLDGALAWFECHNRSRYEEGDHVIFVGEVERCGVNPGAEDIAPLIFHGGAFHGVKPL